MSPIFQALEKLSSSQRTRVLWVLQPHVNKYKLDEAMWAVTNAAIDRYRKVSTEVLNSVDPDRIILWTSLSRHADDSIGAMSDGFHLPLVVLKQGILVRLFKYLKSDPKLEHDFQMLLNLHCNDNMNFNDGSCCKSSDVPTALQKITFYAFAAW